MGQFIDMLNDIERYNSDLEESEELSKFLGVMRKFNLNKPLEKKFKNQIEEYFRYKWLHDKNQFISDKEDIYLLEQMPQEVEDKLYYQYLFKDFLKEFAKYFLFQKTFSKLQYNFFTWNDPIYRDFMHSVLKKIVPRKEEANTILFKELDEITSVFFFSKGQVDIGFEINR